MGEKEWAENTKLYRIDNSLGIEATPSIKLKGPIQPHEERRVHLKIRKPKTKVTLKYRLGFDVTTKIGPDQTRLDKVMFGEVFTL